MYIYIYMCVFLRNRWMIWIKYVMTEAWHRQKRIPGIIPKCPDGSIKRGREKIMESPPFTGWWFQTWLDYCPFHIWDVIRNPLTKIFLRGVGRYTTNQWIYQKAIVYITIITVMFSYFSRWLLHHQPDQAEDSFFPSPMRKPPGKEPQNVAGEWLGMAGNIWIKTWGSHVLMFYHENHEKHVFKHTEITVSRIVLRWFSNHQAEKKNLVPAWTSVDTINVICSGKAKSLMPGWTEPCQLCWWFVPDLAAATW